jgi:hypothetical protein
MSLNNDLIRVLSWNVNWRNMSNGSGKINNVASFIDTASENEDYDFVALQESKNWEIIRERSKSLKSMGYINYIMKGINNTKIELTTFYNKTKYEAIAVSCANLGSGRPFVTIFLRNKKNGSIYIFINLHNRHQTIKSKVENIISKYSKWAYKINEGEYQISILETEYEKKIGKSLIYTKIYLSKESKIIIAGDFNDSGQNFWTRFIPFESIPDKICSSLGIQPPKTCCFGISSKVIPNLIGDYILVSNDDFTINNQSKFNYIPDLSIIQNTQKFPTSDHFPIKSVFAIKNTKPTHPGSKKMLLENHSTKTQEKKSLKNILQEFHNISLKNKISIKAAFNCLYIQKLFDCLKNKRIPFKDIIYFINKKFRTNFYQISYENFEKLKI